MEAFDASEIGDEDGGNAVAAWYEAPEAVMDLPAATTPAGLQAKAAMADKILLHTLKEDQAEPSEIGEHFAALVFGGWRRALGYDARAQAGCRERTSRLISSASCLGPWRM